MTINQMDKKTCINNIRLQFKRMGEVESDNQNIPGTYQRFDVVCSIEGRGLLSAFFPPKVYIVFQFYDKIGDKEVKHFKSKVQDVIADEVNIYKAYMCLRAEKKAERLASDKINFLRDNEDIPMHTFSC